MARVAFYAPMKPPTHPVPSGDRAMARNLMAAIGAQARVDLVSELQVHDSYGETGFQARMQGLAKHETDRLMRSLAENGADCWVTYHNYYKAPDLIGPPVCRALNLPYIQIESTRARSRLTGPWANYAGAAEAATDAADVVLYLTELDLITLVRDRPETQKLIHLRPFLPIDTLPAPAARSGNTMLAVGMMRARDKLASYQIIADTLAAMTGDWHLEIAGDGPERAQVEALMAPFAPRVTFLGQLDRASLARAYSRASLFFWPGVNEAYGMVYLEAQAHGLPVVAQDRPGVRDVVLSGNPVHVEAGPNALANVLTRLLSTPAIRQKLGNQARDTIAQIHLTHAASETIWSAITPLLEKRP
jgi:glycosyltransferase involved in cell wall biosynthesis